MLDLGNHASRPVPRGGLILEAPVSDQRSVAGSTARLSEQILDAPLQDVVGRQADRVPHPSAFQGLVEGGQGKAASARTTTVCPCARYRSMIGRSTSSHPSALWTLPGRSLAARQSPSGLNTNSGG